MRKQLGFTLVELMMVIVIIGVLAAIAIPSYERYTVKNAEEEARAQLGQLEIQLANWRASALSYRGFVPVKKANDSGSLEYGYDTFNRASNMLFVPLGSTADTYRYVVEIFDAGTGQSLVVNAQDEVNIVAGRSWGMIAYPNPSLEGKGAKTIAVASNGQRCQGSSSSVFSAAGMMEGAETHSCSVGGVEKWQ